MTFDFETINTDGQPLGDGQSPFGRDLRTIRGRCHADYHYALYEYFQQIFPGAILGERADDSTDLSIIYYADIERRVPLPALLIETTDFSVPEGDGSEQVTFNAEFEVRVLVDPTIEGAQLTARDYAYRIAAHLHRNPYPIQGHGPARGIVGEHDTIGGLSDSYLVWCVRWSMDILYVPEEGNG